MTTLAILPGWDMLLLPRTAFLLQTQGVFLVFFEERLPKKNFINKLPINSVAFKAKVVTQQKFPKIF